MWYIYDKLTNKLSMNTKMEKKQRQILTRTHTKMKTHQVLLSEDADTDTASAKQHNQSLFWKGF